MESSLAECESLFLFSSVYNWCEIKAKMWVMNLGKPVNVPQLNEAMAIELGANMLGETIVFTIAAGILYFEYARQVSFTKSKFSVCVLFLLIRQQHFLYWTVSKRTCKRKSSAGRT